MGTNATLIYLNDNKIMTSYVHYDGYSSNMSPLLLNHYTTCEKVEALMKRGDMTALDFNIDEISFYNDEKYKKENTCNPYITDAEDIKREFAISAFHTYVFDSRDEEWYYMKGLTDPTVDRVLLRDAYESGKHITMSSLMTAMQLAFGRDLHTGEWYITNADGMKLIKSDIDTRCSTMSELRAAMQPVINTVIIDQFQKHLCAELPSRKDAKSKVIVDALAELEIQTETNNDLKIQYSRPKRVTLERLNEITDMVGATVPIAVRSLLDFEKYIAIDDQRYPLDKFRGIRC